MPAGLAARDLEGGRFVNPTAMRPALSEAREILAALGLEEMNSGVSTHEFLAAPGGGELTSVNPATGEPIARVQMAGEKEYETVLRAARESFLTWREVPAPRRGDVVRQLGEELRRNKAALGALVSLEMGKIRAEGEGEVQEMIDICDFAVGLSRQLYGLSMHSERPGHRMFEQWHPLGIVGIITAFNFPGAVWAWNAAIAAVCGDTMVWKPSSDTPLVAIATQKIANRVFQANGHQAVMNLVIGKGSTVGQRLLDDKRVPLISATGSCAMGLKVARSCAERYGHTILELGGNNAIIVTDDADLDLALRGILFGAVGTAGQRCTSTRRVFLQDGIRDEFIARLKKAYGQVRIGDPLHPDTLMGPLVNAAAVKDYEEGLARIRQQGGEVLFGGKRLSEPPYDKGFWVEPTIVLAPPDMPMLQEELFVPVLYLVPFAKLEDAIRYQNDVPQGLSSAIFTTSLRSAETFLSARGSDCGIANVNIGTSGAEIGGAFGGEKETGGGRESGSDAWKQYMRRQTCTVNWSKDLPLAQGIHFGD
jgi:aldehyde dehydrogenase (NAD+)